VSSDFPYYSVEGHHLREPFYPMIIDQKTGKYLLLFGDNLGRAILIYIDGSWKVFILPSYIELSLGTYSFKLQDSTGNWGNLLSFTLREKTLVTDNCLSISSLEE